MNFKPFKKAPALLLCAVITLTSAVTAFAAGQTYSVPEVANMRITLPDDMTAVTRASSADDKYFSLFGIDYNTNKQNFENSNIYLQGMSGSDLTVTVTMQETGESSKLINYSQLESDKLSEIARNFLSQTEYTACTVDQAVSNVVWLEFNTRVNHSGSLIQAYQANTVYDGKSINVTLQRNGGNVTASDYDAFSQILSSVEFNKSGFFNFSNPYMPYILIGAGVLLILIIVFIIIIVRVASRRKKKSKNDKILEELAGKYTSRSDRRQAESGRDVSERDNDVQDDYYDLETFEAAPKKPEKQSVRHYSDEDIDAMLSKGGEPNFTQALPETGEEPEKAEPTAKPAEETLPEQVKDPTAEPTEEPVPEQAKDPAADTAAVKKAEEEAPEDDTLDNSESISDFFEDEPAEDDEAHPTSTTRKFSFPVKAKTAEPETPEASDNTEETQTGQDEVISAEKPEISEPENSEPEITEPENTSDESPVEATEAKPAEKESRVGTLKDEILNALRDFDAEDDENEDFNNDEVLVRQAAKRTRFDDSSDYFEEAPKKVIGVISSKDIENAEEYDVIGEMERRAGEVEKEPPKKGEAFANAAKSIGAGAKNFFVHCGYFATNVKREIKHKKARKKRQQYEEDRRRRARERAERQRRQAQNGGLVQVHKRYDRKPPQRRPSNPQNRGGNPPRRR